MIGESAGPNLGRRPDAGFGGLTFPISKEPVIVNYTYKTPDFSIGGAHQDPAGDDSGITRQDRWSGILFNDAARFRIVYYPDGQLPEIGGVTVDLKPSMAYDSPFLRSVFNSYVVGAEWGPLRSIYDFQQGKVQHSFEAPNSQDE